MANNQSSETEAPSGSAAANIDERAERRREQNRIAQRNHRK